MLVDNVYVTRVERISNRITRILVKYQGVDRQVEVPVEGANSIPPPDYSELTELVLRAAESGDEVATEVLHREGESLAYLVKLVMRRLHKSADNQEWVAPIAFAGSIMEKVSPVRKALISAVQREFSTVRVLAGVVDPLVGAVWRARNAEPHAN